MPTTAVRIGKWSTVSKSGMLSITTCWKQPACELTRFRIWHSNCQQKHHSFGWRTHTHRIQWNPHARFSKGKWIWMLHWQKLTLLPHRVQVTSVIQHTMYSILVKLIIQAPILHSLITISIPLLTKGITIKEHHRLNQDWNMFKSFQQIWFCEFLCSCNIDNILRQQIWILNELLLNLALW